MAKILIVDDEISVRKSIVAVLKLHGHETIEADNGVVAYDMIKLHPPQLIISDVMMANMNGFMLREILLQNKLTAAVPVILMTGLANNAGAWGSDPSVNYITKPFTIDELMLLVNSRLKA
ncbi:MAG: response regulator [Bacteroidota bacterium]|nr:response regulator [Bacteroidota bacterium]